MKYEPNAYLSIVQTSTPREIDCFTIALGQKTVCRNMNRHMILETDFTAMNFMGVIWTCKGTQKLMHSNGKTIMELQDTTAGIPLAMAYSVKIEPGRHKTVPLECSSQLEDQMDIRVDAGFHH